jgi:hypothetical protein
MRRIDLMRWDAAALTEVAEVVERTLADGRDQQCR